MVSSDNEGNVHLTCQGIEYMSKQPFDNLNGHNRGEDEV